MGNAISIYDKDAKLLFVNSNFCKDLHIDNKSAVIGMHVGDILVSHHKQRRAGGRNGGNHSFPSAGFEVDASYAKLLNEVLDITHGNKKQTAELLGGMHACLSFLSQGKPLTMPADYFLNNSEGL